MHCFSLGIFRGMPIATWRNDSSVGLRSCFCRAHVWSAPVLAAEFDDSCLCFDAGDDDLLCCCGLLDDVFVFSFDEFWREVFDEGYLRVGLIAAPVRIRSTFPIILNSLSLGIQNKVHSPGDPNGRSERG